MAVPQRSFAARTKTAIKRSSTSPTLSMDGLNTAPLAEVEKPAEKVHVLESADDDHFHWWEMGRKRQATRTWHSTNSRKGTAEQTASSGTAGSQLPVCRRACEVVAFRCSVGNHS